MSDVRPNGLLTSASAKVDLVQRMRLACHSIGAQMHAADSDPLAVALRFADGSTVLPHLDDSGFLDELHAYCEQHAIGFILPTRDADLVYFAEHEAILRDRGIMPIVSPAAMVALCQDKIRFHEHCLAHRLPVLPRLLEPDPGDFPCFVRLRHGSASVGSFRADSRVELEARLGAGPWPEALLQPCLAASEYTVDALFDFAGRVVQWIARERLRVKGGESVVGRTVLLPQLDGLMRAIEQAFRFAGPITLQCFHVPPDQFWLIEINARIGGGAALGIAAGLDTPARLLQLVRGDLEGYTRPRVLKYGMTMLRYSCDVFLEFGDAG